MEDNDNLAPIVLFVYNRPWHTLQTLDALMKNDLADQSKLFIYADGPKKDANEKDIQKIKEVEQIINDKNWCGQVEIIQRDENLGLANSVITGVTDIINEYSNVIVLEDDIFVTKGFLKFMNEALIKYEPYNLAGISGWSFDIDIKHNYLSRIGSCWGWATWSYAWEKAVWDARTSIDNIEKRKNIFEFNADGNYPYYEMLKENELKKNDSWAILWYASYFLNNNLFYFPSKSLVTNIGADGTGTHYREYSEIKSAKLSDFVEVLFLDTLTEDINTRLKIVKSLTTSSKSPSTYQRCLTFLKQFIRR